MILPHPDAVLCVLANPILIIGPKQESVEVSAILRITICANRIATKMRRQVGKSFHLQDTILVPRNIAVNVGDSATLLETD